VQILNYKIEYNLMYFCTHGFKIIWKKTWYSWWWTAR